MKAIASRDNPRFKSLRRLTTTASARREAGQALLEGIHLCESFLHAGGVPLCCVLSRSAENHPEVTAIIATLDRKLEESHTRREMLLFDDTLFGSLSQVEHGVGILFVIAVPDAIVPERIASSCVLLDRIQDPGNFGSILRSAAAAGIFSVFASQQCADAWSPKVLRAGMGAHFHLDIIEDCDLEDLLTRIAIPLVATSSHASETIFETDLGHELAWLFGNEGQGIAPALSARGLLLRIPQPGGLESLNVAAAAAICLFEQVRQRA